MEAAARLRAGIASVVLPAIVLLALTPPVIAGGFRVTPILGDVPPDRQVPSFHIHNPDSTPLTVQISGHDWSQSDNVDVVVPSDRLLVVPPLVTIAPGDTQVVRVALKGERPADELSFRLHIHEVLPPPPPGFVGVRTALKVDLPLFFAPAVASRDLDWRATFSQDGGLRLSAENTGSRFMRLLKLSAHAEDGSLLSAQSGPIYILAGATRFWDLPPTTPVEMGATVRLQVTVGRETVQHAVTVR